MNGNRKVTSSIKMMLGCIALAIANNALTSFSLSPKNLEVNVEALIEKNVQLASVATALANIVFPFPGGPNNNKPFIHSTMELTLQIPLGGDLKPVNISGLRAGKITISCKALLHSSSPTMNLVNHSTSIFTYQYLPI